MRMPAHVRWLVATVEGSRVDGALDAASDDVLVAAVGRRDRDALGEVYRRYGGAVWWIANRVCRRAEVAEEVCQAVFAELWARPQRFDRSQGALRTRLVAVAHSCAVDVVAAQERRDEPLGAQEHTDALGKEARQAVDQLATDERDTILLAYFDGPAYVEGERRRTSADDVKTRLRDGLLSLRRTLDAEGVTR